MISCKTLGKYCEAVDCFSGPLTWPLDPLGSPEHGLPLPWLHAQVAPRLQVLSSGSTFIHDRDKQCLMHGPKHPSIAELWRILGPRTGTWPEGLSPGVSLCLALDACEFN